MENKRFLKIFSSQNDYDSQKDSVMGMPHVVLLEDTNEVVYASENNTSSDPYNGFEYVDLGLPSGTMWATQVIGGDNPLYFQWGDTVGYTQTQVENGEKEFDYNCSDYKWNEGAFSCDGSSMTKYNTADGLTVLELEDDAAHVHMGGDWHMPTIEQLKELTANTTSTWTAQNDVNGILFTSNTNGNTLFIPAFGMVYDGMVSNLGIDINVWSNAVYEEYLHTAIILNGSSSDVSIKFDTRSLGFCVLGVVG